MIKSETHAPASRAPKGRRPHDERFAERAEGRGIGESSHSDAAKSEKSQMFSRTRRQRSRLTIICGAPTLAPTTDPDRRPTTTGHDDTGWQYTRDMLDWQAILQSTSAALLGVLGLLGAPQVSTCWCYLLSAAILATLVYVTRDATSPTLRGLIRYLLPRRIYASRTFVDDLSLFVVGSLLYSFFLFGPIQAVLSATATAVLDGLQTYLTPPSGVDGTLARAAVTLATVIVADLAFFVAHLAQHRLPLLWEFHKVHHSAPVLEPFAVFRRHPVDIAFEGVISALGAGVLYGAGIFITGGEYPTPVQLYGVNVLLGAFLLAGFCLQHSHVWLTFGPLGRVLISPAAHQIHHSMAPQHRDQNFGNMLSLWDRCAGTYTRPGPPQRLVFGVDDGASYRGLLRLYGLPLLRALQRMLAGLRRSVHKRD